MVPPNATIDGLLERYRPSVGADHARYHNHVQRVFHNCLLLDADPSNAEKYAVAAVFHDIGIWTDWTFDYLAPSIAQAEAYLIKSGRAEWVTEIGAMVHWHHKLGPYQGPHERTVETFRRADWMDVSLGLLTYGADKRALRLNRKAFPNLGFHGFLVKQALKRFLRHPLDPLPMFTR